MISRWSSPIATAILVGSFFGCGGSVAAARCRVEYEVKSVKEGSGRVVNFSGRLKKCKETFRLSHGERGWVEVRYPPSVQVETVERIARDYGLFFPLAEAVLGDKGYAEVLVYVIPVPEVPDSYRIRAVRRGNEWNSRHLAMLLFPAADPFNSSDYWSSLCTDMHEATHEYVQHILFGSAGAACPNPWVRWFVDGVSELISGLYSERYVPKEFRRKFTNLDSIASAFDEEIFRWRTSEETLKRVSRGDKRAATQEVNRYRAAYWLVRYIYEKDDGKSLRVLAEAFRAKQPVTREGLYGIFKEVLGMDGASLVGRAKQRFERERLSQEATW